MDLIKSVLLVALGFLLAVAARQMADYIKTWLPRIIDYLIDRAIKRLPDEQRDRFAEEWKSYVNDTPGNLRKLIVAIGFLFAANKMADGPRAYERVGAALLLALSAPMMFFTAVIIATSGQPILLRQGSVRADGKRIRRLTFRTIVADPESLRAIEEGAEPPTEMNDPRLTAVGRLLCILGVDHLPLLLNVLMGDISLLAVYQEFAKVPAARKMEAKHKGIGRSWFPAVMNGLKVVPVTVGLMVLVAVTTSQVVLWRFAQDQKSNLGLLTDAYLNGLSAAVLPALVRGNQRELLDALDHARRNRYAGVEPRFVIVELPNKAIAASSDPRRFPVQSVVPDELRSRFADDGLYIDPTTDSAWLARTLSTEWGTTAGRLLAEVDIATSLRVRREILLTLVLVNGCLTLAFALGGYFVLKRIMEAKYIEGRGSGFWVGAAGLMVILAFLIITNTPTHSDTEKPYPYPPDCKNYPYGPADMPGRCQGWFDHNGISNTLERTWP
jgi:hypothetical protein